MDSEEQIVDGEQRWLHPGETDEQRLLIVTVTLRGDDAADPVEVLR